MLPLALSANICLVFPSPVIKSFAVGMRGDSVYLYLVHSVPSSLPSTLFSLLTLRSRLQMSHKIPLLWESRPCNWNELFSISLLNTEYSWNELAISFFPQRHSGTEVGQSQPGMPMKLLYNFLPLSFLSLLSERKSLFFLVVCIDLLQGAMLWLSSPNQKHFHMKLTQNIQDSLRPERETLTKAFIRKQTSRSSQIQGFFHSYTTVSLMPVNLREHREHPVEVLRIFFFGLIITILVKY